MSKEGWGDEFLISRAKNTAAAWMHTRHGNFVANNLQAATPKLAQFNCIYNERIRKANISNANFVVARGAVNLALVMDGTRRDQLIET